MSFLQEWKFHYKSFNNNIKLALLANILSQVGMGFFTVIYNFYVRELGYEQDVIGTIISITSLATAIVLVPAGIMSDRIGRRKMMLIGTGFASIMLFLRSVLESQLLLIVTGFSSGIFLSFLQVSSIPYLAENSVPSQRVHLFSLHSSLMTASNVLGSMLGGIFTDLFSLFLGGLESIRFTLIIGSLFYLLAFIPIYKMDEKPRIRHIKEPFHVRAFLQENKMGLKIIFLFALSQLIIGIGSGLVIPYLNLYFADRFLISNAMIGFIISLGQAATALAMFIGPLVVKKVGEVHAVVYLQLASLPFLILTAFSENLFLATSGFLFRQALMNAGNPIQNSLIMSKVNSSVRGLANSVNQMVFNLGWAFMGPVSTGIVIRFGVYWGYATVFSITAVLYLIASLYFLIVFKKFDQSKNQPLSQKSEFQ